MNEYKKVLKALEEMKMYLTCGGRASGRTYAIMKGAEAQPGIIVIVHSEEYARQLKCQYPGVDVRSPQSRDQLAGIHRPILVDHFYQEILLKHFADFAIKEQDDE